MTVMVDELRMWPKGRGIFAGGSSHLTADSIDELHRFAQEIGLRAAWFQDHPVVPHYDMTPEKREQALRRGAIFIPARDQVRIRNGTAPVESDFD